MHDASIEYKISLTVIILELGPGLLDFQSLKLDRVILNFRDWPVIDLHPFQIIWSALTDANDQDVQQQNLNRKHGRLL